MAHYDYKQLMESIDNLILENFIVGSEKKLNLYAQPFMRQHEEEGATTWVAKNVQSQSVCSYIFPRK